MYHYNSTQPPPFTPPTPCASVHVRIPLILSHVTAGTFGVVCLFIGGGVMHSVNIQLAFIQHPSIHHLSLGLYSTSVAYFASLQSKRRLILKYLKVMLEVMTEMVSSR